MIKNINMNLYNDISYYGNYIFNIGLTPVHKITDMRVFWESNYTLMSFKSSKLPEHTRASFDDENNFSRIYFLTSETYINEDLFEYQYVLDCKGTYPNVLADTWVQRGTFTDLYHESIDCNYPKRYTNELKNIQTINYYIVCVNRGGDNDDMPLPKSRNGIIGNYSMIGLSPSQASTKYTFYISGFVLSGVKFVYHVGTSATYSQIQDVLIPCSFSKDVSLNSEFEVEWHDNDETRNNGGYIDYQSQALPDRRFITYVRNFKATIKIKDYDDPIEITIHPQEHEIDVGLTAQDADYPYQGSIKTIDLYVNKEVKDGVDFSKVISDVYADNKSKDGVSRDVLSVQLGYLPITKTTPYKINGVEYDIITDVGQWQISFPSIFQNTNITKGLNIFGTIVDLDPKYSKDTLYYYTATFDPISPTFQLTSGTYFNDTSINITGNLDVSLPFNITAAQKWTTTNTQTLALHEQSKSNMKAQYNLQQLQRGVGMATSGAQLAAGLVMEKPQMAMQGASGLKKGGLDMFFAKQQLDLDIRNKDANYKLNYLNAVTQPNIMSGSSVLTANNTQRLKISILNAEYIEKDTIDLFFKKYGMNCNIPYNLYKFVQDYGFLKLELLSNNLPKPIADLYKTQLTFWYETKDEIRYPRSIPKVIYDERKGLRTTNGDNVLILKE